MLKSALNLLGGVSTPDDPLSPLGGPSDPLVGSTVQVGGTGVRVGRRIGEGGFAFVYEVSEVGGEGRALALKRLLAADKEKREQIVKVSHGL